MTRKYAQSTSVPIHRSQTEINKLLYNWGAEGAQWTDNWSADPPMVTLKFIWKWTDKKGMTHPLAARFDLVCDMDGIVEDSTLSNGDISESRMEKNIDQWKRTAHRLLLVWLKASFNAVDAGMIDAAQVFMPFLETVDGKILGKYVAENLGHIPAITAQKLLTDGG